MGHFFGSLLGHFWVTFGLLLGHFWVTFWSLLDHFERSGFASDTSGVPRFPRCFRLASFVCSDLVGGLRAGVACFRSAGRLLRRGRVGVARGVASVGAPQHTAAQVLRFWPRTRQYCWQARGFWQPALSSRFPVGQRYPSGIRRPDGNEAGRLGIPRCHEDVTWKKKNCWVTFGSLSGHFWVTFGSLLGHFWVTFGSLLDHFWVTFGLLLDHFWITFGPLFGHF